MTRESLSRMQIATAVTRATFDGDRIGLDSHLQSIARVVEAARIANAAAMQHAAGHRAAASTQSTLNTARATVSVDTSLVEALVQLRDYQEDLNEFLLSIVENRCAKKLR